jgi:tripartite-type tricarboxylate transporter receptor subunit TctC
MTNLRGSIIAGALFAQFICIASADASQYFEGKSINLIVGNPAGGGYDAYARLVSQFMPRHIPGNPKFIVKNMPGAGGLAMANHMYSIAARDGLTIGAMNRSVPLAPLLGNTAAKFRNEDFTWLGTATTLKDDAYMLLVRSDRPFYSIADLQKAGPPQYFGGDGIGNTASDLMLISKKIFNLNAKIIVGYHSSGEVGIAMERGELLGRTLGMSTMRLLYKDALEQKKFRFLLQYRETRWDQMPDVPTARELASPEDRPLLELAELPLLLARVFMAPPKLPPDVTAILQNAFMKTQSDPDYLAEAARLQLDISPLSGSEIHALLAHLGTVSPDVIQKYKVALDDR